MLEISTLDATAQAELVRTGELSARELVDAAIARAEALNPQLNAIITPLYEEARRAASGELPKGPFSGVPFLVKDLVASCAGVRHSECSALLKDHIAERDSELVVRFRQAGLVVLGMTHASELGLLPTTESKLFGRTKNPWDLTRSTGGSSGGSAAAVAVGIVPMAHANDMGGSIRIPAACCGLFGLKPTRARTPLGPDYGDIASGLVHQHVVTRSVRDSASMLDAISGPALGDPYVAPPPERPFRDELERAPGRLRIAFSALSPSQAPVHEDCAKALLATVKLCQELGHELVEAAPKFDAEAMTQAYFTLYGAYTASSLAHFSRLAKRKLEPGLVEPHTWALAEIGRSTSSGDYLNAVATLQRTTREIAHFFVDHDLFLTPTLTEPPPLLGSFDAPPDSALLGLFRAGAYASFTSLANITGQPAMSVPLEVNPQGLPIGIQFMGRFGDEASLFRLAAQLEKARPWAARRPSLASLP